MILLSNATFKDTVNQVHAPACLIENHSFNHSKNLDSTTTGQAVSWVLGIKWETGRMAYILKGKTDNTYIVSGAKSDG